jgi:dipeptidyl aminopeptidase/acylaminoacyl peptidase
MAYFVDSSFASGLYVLNLNSGTSTRILATSNLNPRGVPGDPVWSPDSKQMAIVLPNAYDLDLFVIAPDGSNLRDVAPSGGYEFFPAWSPDGQYLAFVSDRKACPSWEPNAPGSCYKPDALPVDTGVFGGNLYMLDMTAPDPTPRLLSDKWIASTPHWISRDSLAFISSPPGTLDAGSTLWYVDLRSGTEHRITDENPNGTTIFGDTWSSDGNRVIYQEVQTTSHIVMRDLTGKEIGRAPDTYNFPRYAFSAAWAPDNQHVVIGGAHNQCPYGMLVVDTSFKTQVTSPPNPGICTPLWSPDGKWIGLGGVTGGSGDGRYDIYVAEPSGYGTRAVSAKLGGLIALLGWVGGR